MKIVKEMELPEDKHPGRFIKWLASAKILDAKKMSVCMVRLLAGETVTPPHSHPNGEEFIFILEGTGRVMVDKEVSPLEAGDGVLFPQNSIHALQNNGTEELKVICFFSPPADPSVYEYHEGIDFPD